MICLNALDQRTVIIGNSGSGKSTLAAQIAACADCEHVTLDDVYWQDQAFLKKRGQADALELAVAVSQRSRWVIEGVYGWLIDAVTPRATALIWLDLPWDECKAGLEKRGPLDAVALLEFQGLLTWAEAYWTRRSPSSHAGHSKIFEQFEGIKRSFKSRAEVEKFFGCIETREKLTLGS